jgi:hypothetical protein
MDPIVIQRKIDEIKRENAGKRQKSFKRQLLFGLSIIACASMVIGVQFGVANTTRPPTTFRPYSQERQSEIVEERVGSMNTTGMAFSERRSLEDSIIEMVKGEQYSWPEWNIGTNTSGLFLEEFKAAIDSHGFPINKLLSEIIQIHKTTSDMRDIASLTSEITVELTSAHGQLVNFFTTRGASANLRDVLEQTGKRYFAHLAIILFYIWLLVYGPQNLASATLSSVDRDANETAHATSRAFAEYISQQSQSQHAAIMNATQQVTSSQDAQLALTFMQTFITVGTEKARLLLDMAVKSGIVNEATNSALQQSILAIEDGYAPDERAAADALLGLRKGGRKTKKTKGKYQVGGGNVIHLLFTEEAYNSFMGFLIASGSPIAIYLELLMNKIEELLEKYSDEGDTSLDEFIISTKRKSSYESEDGYSYPGKSFKTIGSESPRGPTDVNSQSYGYGGRKTRKSKKSNKKTNKKAKKSKKSRKSKKSKK